MDQDQWQRIRDIFSQASQLPKEQQSAFVQAQSNGDKLVADKVLAMLATQTENADLYNQSGIDNSGGLSQLVNSRVNKVFNGTASLQTGDMIENFIVMSCIGEGGMGSVFLAQRAEANFSQKVAIKVIHRLQNSESSQQRFIRERQILASLNHPHIASFIGGGETKQSQPYIILEYVDGEPIIDYCQRHQLSVNQRLALFQQVLAAIIYAHQNLVIHRDIKPSNVLVNQTGEVKLLDFGIAKLLEPDSEQPTNHILTQEQQRILTPGIASPEQVLGSTITTRSDVYGLGTLLMHMLTEQPVFDTKTLNSRDIESLILEKVPTKPSQVCNQAADKFIQKRASIVRGELDTIVLKALQKQPERRYSSAEQFAEDIHRYLSNYPISAKPDSTWYSISKFIQRNRLSTGIAMLFVGSLVASSIVITGQSYKIQQERDLAIEQAMIAEQTSKYLSDIFNSANPNVNDGKEISAKMLLDSAYDNLNALDTPALTKADLTLTLSNVYSAIGEYKHAKSLMDTALDWVAQVPKDNAKKIELELRAVDIRGGMLNTLGEYQEAIDLYTQALADIMLQQGVIHQLNSDAYDLYTYYFNYGLAIAFSYQEQNLESLKYYKTALAVAERTPNLQGTQLVEAYMGYGSILRHLGEYEESAKVLDKGLILEKSINQTPTLNLAYGFNQLASTLYSDNKFDEALKFALQGLEIRRDIHQYGHVEVIASLGMTANIYAATNRMDDAIEIRKELLKTIETILGNTHPFYALTSGVLSQCYLINGDYQLAKIGFLNTIKLMDDNLAQSSVRHTVPMIGLGQVALQQHMPSDALQHFNHALDFLDKHAFGPIRQRAKALSLHAVVRMGSKDSKPADMDQAKADLADAYEMMNDLHNKDDTFYKRFESDIQQAMSALRISS